MTRFIIIACFLAVQLNCGLSVETVTFSKARKSAELHVPDNSGKTCVITSNKGEKYTYEPDFGTVDNNPRIQRESSKSCSVALRKANKDDLGYWTITQYNINGSSKTYEYNIYFETKGQISTTYTMKIYKGHYAIVKIVNDLKDIISCEVTTPKKETFNILKDNKTDIEQFGTCGVQITVDWKFEGIWRLAAINKDKEIVSAEFDIVVEDDRNLITDQQNISLKLGSSGDINLDNIESSYCQLTDSHGVQLPLIIGKCNHHIEVVNSYHDGVWKARYGVRGRLNPIDIDIMVTTYDAEAVVTYINVAEDSNDINMACRLRTSSQIYHCLFTSPTGRMLQMNPGIGIEKYEFYEGTDSGATCGITIRKPDDDDYGTWKCELTLDTLTSKRYGSFLNLYRDMFDDINSTDYAAVPLNNVRTFGYDVSVKQNDSFTIKCGADTILNYCWLRSPDGITYSITTDKESLSSNTLLYTGLGLDQGECGAIVENAVYEHKGAWSCYMGIKNQAEIEAIVQVAVEDNYIVAEETTVTYNGKNNQNLFCRLLPHLNKNLDYCRWIRPDGRGIYGDMSHRYLSEMNDERCSLIILGNELEEVDVGRWTCIAGLSGRTTEEVSATIDVNMSSMGTATLVGIIIGCCSVFAIAACVIILINFRRRRSASVPSQNPPPYDVEQIQGIPPKSMLQVQMQYDQKNWVN